MKMVIDNPEALVNPTGEDGDDIWGLLKRGDRVIVTNRHQCCGDSQCPDFIEFEVPELPELGTCSARAYDDALRPATGLAVAS